MSFVFYLVFSVLASFHASHANDPMTMKNVYKAHLSRDWIEDCGFWEQPIIESVQKDVFYYWMHQKKNKINFESIPIRKD